ncbi:YbaB/EbfC family nucleoid-associated protein [Pseudonocardia nigra]|uniref:YbaB/EbfC family nucleoid-associated protein n=1 Tax=Pseudonocardia nigra TaxID=1921578 RepID=UPI001C60374B|nr:YbaB/EbfC family nucleoid-associated protein [Pseudonocardia nigra]
MDGQQWLTSYQERLRDIRARTTAAQRALAEVSGTATSRDGAVTVTVTPGGALQQITFAERADDLTRAQLAAAVLATARQAQAEAARSAADAVAPVLGADSEAMAVLRSHFGAPELLR